MVNNFIKPGPAGPLCVSRTSFNWGIPVDFDPGHVVYVWVDALSNYIDRPGLRYERQLRTITRNTGRPTCILIGKEIVRFHTIHLARDAHERSVCRCPKRSSVTAGCCWTAARCRNPRAMSSIPYLLAAALRRRCRCASSCCARSPSARDGNFSNELLISYHQHRTWPTTWATSSPGPSPWCRSTSAARCRRSRSEDAAMDDELMAAMACALVRKV